MKIEKEKGKSSPPRLGRIRPNPLSLARPRSSPPRGPHGPSPLARPRPSLRRCQPDPTRQPRSPSLPRNRPLSNKRAPLVSPFLAPVTKLSARSPSVATRPVVSLLTRSPARLAPCVPISLRQPEPSRHPPAQTVPSSPLCAIIAALASSPVPATSPPFPAPGAYKKDRPSSIFLHTGLGHSLSPPLSRIELRAAAPYLRSGELHCPLFVEC
jgi:hypothetical protein